MSRVLCAALCLLFVSGARAQSIRLTDLRAERAAVQPNLLPDPGFEQGQNGIPQGWQWDPRNTDATCTLDASVARNGKQSLRLTNGTPFGAHIYGTLWRPAPIPLAAGKPYTLSAYVRSADPGIAWIGGGAGWQFRLGFPATGRAWRRVWTTFTPGPADADFVLRIVTESPNSGIHLDDVKIEPGVAPTAFLPSDAPTEVELSATTPETTVEGDGAFSLSFAAFLPRPVSDAVVEATFENAPPALRRSVALPDAGPYALTLAGEAAGATTAPRVVRLRLLDGGNEIARASVTVRFLSAMNARARLAALRGQLPALKRAMGALQARGGDNAYPLVTETVLENFADFVGEDLRAKPPLVRRAVEQLDALEAMAARLRRDLASNRRFPAVPRWTGRERPRVVGPAFVAPTQMGKRPVFFTGYGHFGQVRRDIERFPGYGANILQIEAGPSALFPAPGRTDSGTIRDLRSVLDRAARAGVAVNLLISPHYFPEWMRARNPELRKRREGFLQFSLYEKSGQELLRRYVAALLAPLKDHPALHSICLSNEPVNIEEPGEAQRAMWREWLQKRHGNVATLNRRWNANYADFADVPLPNPYAPPPVGPLWMDYVHFNQDFFAGWHGMLADAVHAAAPDLPVHAKAMTWTFTNAGDVRYGVDAFLFGRFSGINGNDSQNWYSHGQGEWAQGWQGNALSHDLQRSVRDAPVFNSENHVIPDRDGSAIPPEHLRAALWQAAIHGQSATTIWVWERTTDPASDFAGSVLHRPLCVEAVGIVGHDLNRAALDVAALQRAAPQALILQSPTAAVWDGARYDDCLHKLYTALSFTGLKIGFASERGLEAGQTPGAPILFVPNVAHLSDPAFAALRRFRGRIVFVGESDTLLTRDEYDHPRTERLPDAPATLPFRYGPTTWRDLWQALPPVLAEAKAAPGVSLRDAWGQPVWGVEWRSVRTAGGTVVNACNYRNEAVRVSLRRAGKASAAVDVLTGERVAGAFALRPLEIRLLRLP